MASQFPRSCSSWCCHSQSPRLLGSSPVFLTAEPAGGSNIDEVRAEHKRAPLRGPRNAAQMFKLDILSEKAPFSTQDCPINPQRALLTYTKMNDAIDFGATDSVSWTTNNSSTNYLAQPSTAGKEAIWKLDTYSAEYLSILQGSGLGRIRLLQTVSGIVGLEPERHDLEKGGMWRIDGLEQRMILEKKREEPKTVRRFAFDGNFLLSLGLCAVAGISAVGLNRLTLGDGPHMFEVLSPAWGSLDGVALWLPPIYFDSSNQGSQHALYVALIGVYCASMGLLYHRQVDTRGKDVLIVGSVGVGAVAGFTAGLDPLGVILGILPGCALAALAVFWQCCYHLFHHLRISPLTEGDRQEFVMLSGIAH